MENIDTENHLVAFTDGSSLGNPGPGGWGAMMIFSKLNELVELGGANPKTTNNEMELTAILSVLSYAINNSEPLHIMTDSQYAINGITGWMYAWKRNGWKTQSGDEVKNKFTWQAIYDLVQERGKSSIHFHHVSAHVGIPGNERVDDIARLLAGAEHVPLYRGKLSEYSIKNILSLDIIKQKSSSKKSSKGKAYSYLSLVDGELQKHDSWAACEARVKGKRAKFKKALSATHEQEIIAEWGIK